MKNERPLAEIDARLVRREVDRALFVYRSCDTACHLARHGFRLGALAVHAPVFLRTKGNWCRTDNLFAAPQNGIIHHSVADFKLDFVKSVWRNCAKRLRLGTTRHEAAGDNHRKSKNPHFKFFHLSVFFLCVCKLLCQNMTRSSTTPPSLLYLRLEELVFAYRECSCGRIALGEIAVREIRRLNRRRTSVFESLNR